MANLSTRDSPNFLTIHSLAAQLGVAPQTIYRWRSEGADLPAAFKIGNNVRWRQAVVDAWVLEHEGQPALSRARAAGAR
jgi:predicted DNA-binding transcriptional regulator AlpA